jgi:OCRE domain
MGQAIPTPSGYIGGPTAANTNPLVPFGTVGAGGINGTGIPNVTVPTAPSTYDTTNLANLLNQLSAAGQQTADMSRVPNELGLETQSSTDIGQALAGQLPQDVINQIAQSAGEWGVGTGSPTGPSTNAALLRSLGLNSLGMMGQGEQWLSAAAARNPVAQVWSPAQIAQWQTAQQQLGLQAGETNAQLAAQILEQQMRDATSTANRSTGPAPATAPDTSYLDQGNAFSPPPGPYTNPNATGGQAPTPYRPPSPYVPPTPTPGGTTTTGGSLPPTDTGSGTSDGGYTMSGSGYYDPSSGLYYDPTSDTYFDPSTGVPVGTGSYTNTGTSSPSPVSPTDTSGSYTDTSGSDSTIFPSWYGDYSNLIDQLGTGTDYGTIPVSTGGDLSNAGNTDTSGTDTSGIAFDPSSGLYYDPNSGAYLGG